MFPTKPIPRGTIHFILIDIDTELRLLRLTMISKLGTMLKDTLFGTLFRLVGILHRALICDRWRGSIVYIGYHYSSARGVPCPCSLVFLTWWDAITWGCVPARTKAMPSGPLATMITLVCKNRNKSLLYRFSLYRFYRI